MHVRVPDSAALQPAEITVEAWVLPTLISGDQTVIADNSPTGDAWVITVINGKPRSRSKHLVQRMVSLESPSVIPLNEWTHLAISFDGATKRLFVNGVEVASQSGLSALVYDGAPVPVTIGCGLARNAPRDMFTGRVDEVSVYRRALSPDEIFALFEAGSAGKSGTGPYFTSPSRLPDVASGASYSQQMTTILGTAPISFSLSEGALPPGMVLSSAGLVSGVSNASGTFDFTALATDAGGMATEQQCVLRVLQPVALPADMVAWWRGEPATGDTVPDIMGGHDGGFFSGNTASPPSYTPAGKVGNAFAFDGTLYVRVPDAVELRPNEMTAEAWVFPTVLSDDNHKIALARGYSMDPLESAWLMDVRGALDTPRFLSNHLDIGNRVLDAPSGVPLNQWTHLAISFDGTTKRLFVNGVEVASQSGLSALVYDPASVPVTIGCGWQRNAPIYRFTGRVDEVSLYRRALSPDEIFALFDAGSAGKSATGPYINSSSELPVAPIGQAYAFTFTSVRGTTPVVFSLSQNALPPGLTLTPEGLLSGVPTQAARFVFVVRVTDSEGLFAEQRCAVRAS